MAAGAHIPPTDVMIVLFLPSSSPVRLKKKELKAEIPDACRCMSTGIGRHQVAGGLGGLILVPTLTPDFATRR
jgi:hypothetical protein